MKLNLFIALAKFPECKGSISQSSLSSSGIDQGNEVGRLVQDFVFLLQGFESFSSGLSQARWCHKEGSG